MNLVIENQNYTLDELQIKVVNSSQVKSKIKSPIWISCCYGNDSDDDPEIESNRKVKQSIKESIKQNYVFEGIHLRRKNELVILGDLKEGDVCLIHITQKNFFIDYPENNKNQIAERRLTVQHSSSHSSTQSFQSEVMKGNIYFSLYIKGIKFNIHDYYNALPEKVYRFLANRIKQEGLSGVFLDGMCEHGAGLIFFGMTGIFRYLVGADKNIEHLKSTLHNSEIYKIEVDIFKAKFTDLNFNPSLKPSLLFIKPDYIYQEGFEQEEFSLRQHLIPNIYKVLKQSFKLGKNIILVLPKFTKMEELAQCIAKSLQQNQKTIRKFEVQVIQINGIVEHYVVYFGVIAKVQDQDEYFYLASTLLSDSSYDDRIIPCLQLIHTTVQTIGFQRTLQLIGQAKGRAQEISTETTLSIFLNMLVKDNIISKQTIRDKFQTEDLTNLLNGTPQYKFEDKSILSQDILGQSQSPSKKRTLSRAHFNYPSISQKIKEDISYQRNSLYQKPFQSFSFHDENI